MAWGGLGKFGFWLKTIRTPSHMHKYKSHPCKKRFIPWSSYFIYHIQLLFCFMKTAFLWHLLKMFASAAWKSQSSFRVWTNFNAPLFICPKEILIAQIFSPPLILNGHSLRSIVILQYFLGNNYHKLKHIGPDWHIQIKDRAIEPVWTLEGSKHSFQTIGIYIN